MNDIHLCEATDHVIDFERYLTGIVISSECCRIQHLETHL